MFDISQKAHSSADPFRTKLNASVARKRNNASEAIDAPVSCTTALDHLGAQLFKVCETVDGIADGFASCDLLEVSELHFESDCSRSHADRLAMPPHLGNDGFQSWRAHAAIKGGR
jgi:hypothetical protein